MVTLKIDNKNYEMPNKWSEINLEQYKKIVELTKHKSHIYLIIELISYLAGVDKKTLRNADLDDIRNLDLSWLDKRPSKKVTEFEINGQKYKVDKFNNIKLGTYADIEEYSKEPINNLHYIVAILVREVKGDGIIDYNENDLENRANIFYNNLNIEHLLGIANFFLNGKLK